MRIVAEPGSPATVCFLLHGSQEQVLLARCVLKNLVSDCRPVVEALEVPQTSFGRIIGIELCFFSVLYSAPRIYLLFSSATGFVNNTINMSLFLAPCAAD